MIASYDTINLMKWKPINFALTSEILTAYAEIERLTGKVEGVQLSRSTPKLRKKNLARTVWGSTGIEGSSSSIEQVEALMRGETVTLSKKEQLEIINALNAYAGVSSYDPFSLDSLLRAHAQLMKGLMLNAGNFRQEPVEVYISEFKTRAMPSWQIVPQSMEMLFETLRSSKEPMLFKSIRFHFDFVNLHPFTDGNGRAARLWQTRLMMEEHSVFEFLDVESIIFERRDEYYQQIRSGQKRNDINGFVRFMLTQIKLSLESLWEKSGSVIPSCGERLSIAAGFFGAESFTRKDYVQLFKTISSVTASRDLSSGFKNNLLRRTGDKRTSVYRFKSENGS